MQKTMTNFGKRVIMEQRINGKKVIIEQNTDSAIRKSKTAFLQDDGYEPVRPTI